MTTLSSRMPLSFRRALALLALAALPACAHARAETATAPVPAPPNQACDGPHEPHGPPGPPPNPEEWIAARVAELTQALSLDEAQQAEARSALTEAHTRMEALRTQPGAPSPGHPPDPAWREQMRQIHDQADDRIWASLRCDQKDRMHVYEREQRQRFHRGPHGHGPHGGPHPHGPPPPPSP